VKRIDGAAATATAGDVGSLVSVLEGGLATKGG
jgi:hypothetical protein